MFRVALTYFVLTSVSANRIKDHESESVLAISKSQFGASCEDLREMFHDRLAGLQTFIDERQESTDLSRVAQGRLLMRVYSVVRTLRRAQECSWVVDGNSDDIDQVGSMVQTFLADNPCAAAARAELEAGTSDATEEIAMRSVMRATAILNSEDCQVSDEDVEAMAAPPIEEAEVKVQMDELDAQVQDQIDDLVDEGSAGVAFLEMDNDVSVQWTWRGFLRGLSVAFMFILLALACIGVAWGIGLVLGFAISASIFPSTRDAGLAMAFYAMIGAAVGGTVGIAACSYQLVTDFLPKVAN